MNIKKLSCFFLLALIILTFSLNALVIQSKRYDIIIGYVDENTLVLTDLDNTVMEPTTELGSDQWVTAAFKQAGINGLTHEQILTNILPRCFELQQDMHMRLVEPVTRRVILGLQKCNIPVYAITSRSLPLVPRTFEQLYEIDIDFSKTGLGKHEFSLKYPAKLEHGVIFCGANNKGEVLKEFLSKNHLNPSKIIFIDDKNEHLISVEEMAEELGITFIGIRYGRLDKKVKKFHLDNTSKKWVRNTCEHVLSPQTLAS